MIEPSTSEQPKDISEAIDPKSWIAGLEDLIAEEGYVLPLGSSHWAYFVDAGPILLVTFETLQSARAREGQMPLGGALADSQGWSHLCLIADGDTWYRDPAVYAHFDQLVDDAFFDDFDRVLFYGAGMGGYAACAFSVVSPGAQVLAISPRATLNPAIAGWDRRDITARRLDFTSRYGYAPDMTEGAAKVTLVCDPTQTEDAMHTALFRAPWICKLSTRLIDGRVEWALLQMGVLDSIINLAMAGRLDAVSFAKLWRKRRDFSQYLRIIIGQAVAKGRQDHIIMIYRSIAQRMPSRRNERKLASLLAQRDEASRTTAEASATE